MSIHKSISVVIPTLNCGEKLRRCLESVKWVDEIIVVDQGSNDNTVKIARQFNSKVFIKKPANGNFDLNRLFGMKQSTSEWVLKLDSDEQLSLDLQKEIREFIKRNSVKDVNGLYLKNRVFILGHHIKHGVVNKNSGELRLVRRGTWTYNPQRYHQQIAVTGKILVSSNYYFHYNYESIHEFLQKTNKYTELDSEFLKSLPNKYSWLIYFEPVRSFVKNYIFRLGFLDGRIGFIVSWLFAFYNFIDRAKRIEKSSGFNNHVEKNS